MNLFRTVIVAAGVACLPMTTLAQSCETLGTVGTDGHGDPSRKRIGGTYLPVPIETIAHDGIIKVVPQGGPYKYVTLHTRTDGGSWSTAYQGNRTDFPGTDPVFEECRNQQRCTHIIFSVNGAHERYDSVVSSARIDRCAIGGDLVLDTTWTAPKSGWQIDLPHDWSRDVNDDPAGGTGMFIDPGNDVVVGVTTLDHGRDHTAETLIPLLRDNMFQGAKTTFETPVVLGGLNGTLYRYELVSNGSPYVAMASYLTHSDTRMYIVWGMVPEAMGQTRGEDAVTIMNTFRLIAAAPPPTPETPLSLAMLVMGQDERVGKHPGADREVIDLSAPRIYIAARFVGSDRHGTIQLSVSDMVRPDPMYTRTHSLAGQPTDQPVILDTVIERPRAGWRPGTYRLIMSHNGIELGSRIFTLEGQQ